MYGDVQGVCVLSCLSRDELLCREAAAGMQQQERAGTEKFQYPFTNSRQGMGICVCCLDETVMVNAMPF